MTRLTAKDFPPQILELYDGYAHGRLSRREFLDRAALYPVAGMAGAAAVLAALRPDYAQAQQVEFSDPEILPEYVTYPSPDGTGDVRAYMVRPATPVEGAQPAPEAATGGPFPAVVVVHENRGLNPYIEDVARRLAKAGFLALAPDGLSSVGGYPGNDEEGRALQSGVDPEALMNDFLNAVTWLQGHELSTGNVGIVGFCYGGGVSNAAAVAIPDLKAAVPFYGRQPDAADVPRINAPILLHYAGLDTRINEGWPAYEAALQANGKTYEAHVYEGVNHGFHNDSTPRYDAEAAELAWSRTLGWFDRYLR